MYLTGVSQSLLAAILYDAGLGRFSGYNKMLENALDDTNLHFQQKGIEFRKDELRRILRGDLAQRELARFQHGDRFIDGDELAKEFARLGDLYFEDESRGLSVAKEILKYFVQQFEKYQLADAKTNVPVLLSYLKILSNAASLEHRQMMGSLQRVEQTQQKMEQQIAELAAVSKTRTARETAIMRDNALPQPIDSNLIGWDRDWKPRKTVGSVEFDGEVSAAELKPGAALIVLFEKRPSGAWHDPQVASAALWEAKTTTARALPQFLWRDLRLDKGQPPDAETAPAWKVWPLCIPSYDVSVEWRLESYCFFKPWGDAKERIVQAFLTRCSGKELECRVISLARPGRQWTLLVQSADYDDFLHMQWPYYKGLESALARGQYYKSKAVQGLNGAKLEEFAKELAANPRFRDLIPKRYRQHFEQRSIHRRDVHLMLTGIIERERRSREDRQLQ
jgi:hypothetical protein